MVKKDILQILVGFLHKGPFMHRNALGASAVATKAIGLVAAIFLSTALAKADFYDWSFNCGATSCSGSGVFETTGPTPTTITDVTGTWGGASITGLAPVGTFQINDNSLPLDIFGVSFHVSTALNVNMFFTDTYQYRACDPTPGFCGISMVSGAGQFSFAPASAVPGPVVGAGLPGLIIACGGLIAWRRKRRHQAAQTTA
jgi:hypothetical protein